MSIQVVAFNLEHYANFQDAKLSGALEVLDTPDFNSNPKGALKCASNYQAGAKRFGSAEIAIGLLLPNDEGTKYPLCIDMNVATELMQSILNPDSSKDKEPAGDQLSAITSAIASGIEDPKSVDFVYYDSTKYETIFHAIEADELHTFDLYEGETSYNRMDNIQRAIDQVSQFNGVKPTYGAYDAESSTFMSMTDMDNAAHFGDWDDIMAGFILARRLKIMNKI